MARESCDNDPEERAEVTPLRRSPNRRHALIAAYGALIGGAVAFLWGCFTQISMWLDLPGSDIGFLMKLCFWPSSVLFMAIPENPPFYSEGFLQIFSMAIAANMVIYGAIAGIAWLGVRFNKLFFMVFALPIFWWVLCLSQLRS